MSWADLPVDILFIIFGSLDDNISNHSFFEIFQCLAVCRSWRFVAKHIWQNSIMPTTPWLMFHTDACANSRKIVFDTNLFNKYLPSATHGGACTLNRFILKTYSSYNGWLLVGDSNKQPFLYNPITTLLLQLPPMPQPHLLHNHIKFILSEASPTDHNCIVCIKMSSKHVRSTYYSDSFLLFCRPASSTPWVVLEEWEDDIIFRGGNLYAIGMNGELRVYNNYIINGNETWRIVAEDLKFWCFDDSFFFYLVESKHGELLMIMRTVERRNYSNCSTLSFRIFKLNNFANSRSNDYYHYCWEEISSLPEKESIILVWNEGMCISVDDHNGYKSNTIYFYDEEISGQATTYGAYDLGNRKISYKSQNAACYHCRLFTPSKISNV